MVRRMSDDGIASAQRDGWPRPRLYTVDDYYRMAEVGLLAPDDRTELIEGEIVDMAPIGPGHAAALSRLGERLIPALVASASVRIQLPVRFVPLSEPQPDLAIVTRRRDSYRRAHPAARDILLLIEVSESTLRYDLEAKARLYAKHAVPEYWVIDLVHQRIVRHRAPSGGKYRQIDEIATGVLPLPELSAEIVLAELF